MAAALDVDDIFRNILLAVSPWSLHRSGTFLGAGGGVAKPVHILIENKQEI